jgi:hypothetical protein
VDPRGACSDGDRFAGGAGVYLESPSGGPEWKLRTAVTFLLPGK